MGTFNELFKNIETIEIVVEVEEEDKDLSEILDKGFLNALEKNTKDKIYEDTKLLREKLYKLNNDFYLMVKKYNTLIEMILLFYNTPMFKFVLKYNNVYVYRPIIDYDNLPRYDLEKYYVLDEDKIKEELDDLFIKYLGDAYTIVDKMPNMVFDLTKYNNDLIDKIDLP
jgi:uncharacterized protein YbaR (Trm112 family)